MVKGDWIFFMKEMRCKNWVNGIEVVFSLDTEGEVSGKIHRIPRKLLETLDAPGTVIRLRRQATAIFSRIYEKKILGGA